MIKKQPFELRESHEQLHLLPWQHQNCVLPTLVGETVVQRRRQIIHAPRRCAFQYLKLTAVKMYGMRHLHHAHGYISELQDL